MPTKKPTSRVQLALPLALLMIGGCVGREPPLSVQIPAPVEKVYVYKPLDAALLRCKIAPTDAETTDDLEGAGLYNRTRDAWEDCWKRLACIAKIYGEEPCDVKSLGLKE